MSRSLRRLLKQKPAEARLEAFISPAAAMERDFEGLTEEDLKELERSVLDQVASGRGSCRVAAGA